MSRKSCNVKKCNDGRAGKMLAGTFCCAIVGLILALLFLLASWIYYGAVTTSTSQSGYYFTVMIIFIVIIVTLAVLGAVSGSMKSSKVTIGSHVWEG